MDDYNDQVGQDIYGSEDPYLQNEALDLERAYDSGGAEYGDPAVIYLVVPLWLSRSANVLLCRLNNVYLSE
jgi:hypothetical protein